APGVQSFLEQMAPALDAWALENMIPQKPDYLSKQTAKTVYLSRYTYEELILGPQMLIAEFNLIFGVIAIVAAIPTGGGSLYLLAAADVALGAAMIWVNAEKLIDLKNGDDSTNPSLFGIDQSMLDKLGIALTVVNLGILLKHGLYAAANKLANGRNISALDDTWTKFKLENVKPPKPKEAPALPKTKTTTKEPTKGGPGVNRPIDEFDDASIYQRAGKGKPEPPHATGGKVEGTGNVKPPKGSTPNEHRYALDPDTNKPMDFEWVTTRTVDPILDKEILENAAKFKGKLSNTVLKSGKGNFSYAKVDLDVELPKNDYYAHSQVDEHSGNPNIKDISELPDDPIFEATVAPNALGIESLRVDDTEYKILNEIAKNLGNNTNAKGKITLFTEKDTCGSCNYIIRQFMEKYKNIQIDVIHNKGNPIVPIK
ncbi:deaminase domain-containing protein, partial [Paenibacillus algorifonticola]|uniref:deaminase domain-containing protein n=1 Tax=Paenibacillus algorifonticola TaxID=684063 RepID=UPI003D2977EB